MNYSKVSFIKTKLLKTSNTEETKLHDLKLKQVLLMKFFKRLKVRDVKFSFLRSFIGTLNKLNYGSRSSLE